MNRPKTNSLSNTIGLEIFLVDHGVEAFLAHELCMQLGKIAEKIRDDRVYALMNESQLEYADGLRTDKDVIEQGFGGIVGNPKTHIDYIGADDLCGHEKSRDEQIILYRTLNKRPLRDILGLSGGLKRDKSKKLLEEDVDYCLRKEVNRALGTHQLRDVLDQTYGHVFSKMLKENISDLWFGYCAALITRSQRVEPFAMFCPMTTKTLPLGQNAKEPDLWFFFVHRSKAKRLG